MAWPFWFQRPPAAAASLQAQASARPWRPVDTPASYDQGVPDPERPGVSYFPSPYSVPTGIRGTSTSEGWHLAWRYLERGERLRRQRIGTDPEVWAWTGRHSQRLLGLTCLGDASPTSVAHAMEAWLSQQRVTSCSHAEVMQRLTEAGVLREALAGAP